MTGMFDAQTPEHEWRGINSRGQAVGGRGRLGRTVTLWVERKFALGWPFLEVHDVGEGSVIARIGLNVDGKRTWWAVADPSEAS